MLAFAGEYFSTLLGGGLLQGELALSGFEGGKSVASTRNHPGSEFSHLPGAPDGCSSSYVDGAYAFRDEAEEITMHLIERWLPAFCSPADDLFRWLRDPHG